METLTYPYGETPEAVIRERLAAVFAPTGETEPFEIADAMVNWGGYADDGKVAEQRGDFRNFLAAFVSVNHLLTVLDALLKASNLATVIHTPPGSGQSPIQRDPVPMQLRISILAALGVTEK